MEWDSLLFFAGLFVFTEGISELGRAVQVDPIKPTLKARN